MVLEATMILLDNSSWMRNGDYTPSRVDAEVDAANMLFTTKINDNPESAVGLLTTSSPAGSPEVLVTLTRDLGKILTGLHRIDLTASPASAAEGASGLMEGLQVAGLALKHRQNRNQRQRIIAFIASPIQEDERALVRIGKKLKKNSVAVDLISFGEHEENEAKLQAFISAINSNDNSHLVIVPPGPYTLGDKVRSSVVVRGEEGEDVGGMGGGGEDFEFGVDPSIDPELALALRMSMEEERARQGTTAPAAGAEATETTALLSEDVDMEALTEDEQMARAIAMSMGGEEAAIEEDQHDDMMEMLGGLPGVDAAQLERTLRGEEEDKDKDKKTDGQGQ